jgi:hypothetical protein
VEEGRHVVPVDRHVIPVSEEDLSVFREVLGEVREAGKAVRRALEEELPVVAERGEVGAEEVASRFVALRVGALLGWEVSAGGRGISRARCGKETTHRESGYVAPPPPPIMSSSSGVST